MRHIYRVFLLETKDIEEAMKAARQLPSYKKLMTKFKAIENARMNKNGTFTFEAEPESDAKSPYSKRPKAGGPRYIVYGNGVIRREGMTGSRNESGKGWITRLKAPKPALVHGDPVKSLVKIYDNCFKELASKKNLDESMVLEAKVKAYKVTIPGGFLKGTPKQKEDLIFGEDEGDDSFAQNQDILTIESIKVDPDGVTVYIYPHWDDDDANYAATQQKLQKAFDRWVRDQK